MEGGSVAAEQLGAEVARSGSRDTGLLGVDTAEAIERADVGERGREEVSVIGVCEGHEVRLGQDALVDLFRRFVALFWSQLKVRGPVSGRVTEDRQGASAHRHDDLVNPGQSSVPSALDLDEGPRLPDLSLSHSVL
jgi:hypothetical protein